MVQQWQKEKKVKEKEMTKIIQEDVKKVVGAWIAGMGTPQKQTGESLANGRVFKVTDSQRSPRNREKKMAQEWAFRRANIWKPNREGIELPAGKTGGRKARKWEVYCQGSDTKKVVQEGKSGQLSWSL